MAQTSPAKVKVTRINQVCLMVKDIQKTMENYWNILGIGPWDLYDMHAPMTSELTYHGKPGQFKMKVALAMVGPTQLELIEPVSGESMYSDFLAEHGEGLQHLQFVADNADEITQIMTKQGFPSLMGGHVGDGIFDFYDTAYALKTIWEIFQPWSKEVSPDYHYPENEAQTSPAKVKVSQLNQVAIVVKDLQKVMENYWNILGIGPWDIYSWEAPLVYNRKYHGKPAWAKEKIALTQVGAVELELCQPVDGDSIYQDFLMEYGEGLHHMNFKVDDVDEIAEILAKEGFPSVQSGCCGDNGAFNYIDIKPLRTIWEPSHYATNMGVEPSHYPV